MTVRDTLSWITGTLQSAGIESGEVEACWMLWQLTGSSPVQLRLRGESPVSPEHLQQLETWVRRRSQREPLQHILGTAPFLEWELEVSGDVLVPRPETEVLALKDDLMPRYARLIYNGYWFSPERLLLQQLIDESQKCVNGTVKVKLYKGTVTTVGRASKTDSLFDPAISTFEDDKGAYDQADAGGFIKLNALRMRIAANLRKKRK